MKPVSLLLAATVLVSIALGATRAEDTAVPVTSRVIAQFAIGNDRKNFGALEFIGGVTYSSTNPLLGAMSGIRFGEDRQTFLAILDTGHWLTGKVVRDREGRIEALSDVTVASMMAEDGRAQMFKGLVDAEGLALSGDRVLVSFEQRHRIDEYGGADFVAKPPVGSLDIPFDRSELRSNQGLEALAVAPATSPLGMVPVVVAERSLDENGDLYAAVLEGPMRGEFRVRRQDPWDVTDAAFLPDGDLLLLERRFRLSDGVGMRIRRIAGEDIEPGAVVDGDVLIDADMSHQIDNMEGLDVVVMPDGDIRIIVVSDDNHSILQRNLMLEFRLTNGD
ncbi:esterase-like activity of phytase family protein [Rhizobium sp. TRM95111]|uniref:esterase-like activity of phytase family protein n=1 Tax=Rhizobium alarense TaxID=2846851 RepID=UPI001F2E1F62|nr:esterase-like activity of phytase family protein [Rhizobium alarense]MCF3641000.1 esterase-like activity of phytase family protein [Rhizobium alarense]